MNIKNIGIINILLLFVLLSKCVEANPLITEVYYDPPAPEEEYEFVELYNPTSSPINLSNYKLADGEGTYQFPTGTVLPAYGTITIASKASGFWTLFLNKNPDFEYATETNLFVPNMVKRGGSFALSNNGDEVILSDAFDAVIDVVVYEAGSYTGVISHSTGTTEGKSLQREPPDNDRNDCSQDFIAGSPTPTTLRNIIISPTAGTVGSLVTVSGQGFFATEEIIIDFGTTSTITTTTTNADGSFSVTFTVTLQTGCGSVTVNAKGLNSEAKATTIFIIPLFIQPYLQNPGTSSMTIMWWTETSESSNQVEYGTGYSQIVSATNELFTVTGEESRYLHMATISGLVAETTYPYRVRSGGVISNTYTFTTAVLRDSNFRVAILGDGRTDNDTIISRHRAVTNLALSRQPNLTFHNGDEVWEGYDIAWVWLYRRVCTASDSDDPGSRLASLIPYHFTVGNHEIYDGGWSGGIDTSMKRFKAYCHNPPNNSSNPHWEERYYRIDYGCAAFIVLDTNNTSNDTLDNHDYLADDTTPDWEPNSEQYNWLISQLQDAQQNCIFTFILMHPAPYSRGVHGAPDEPQSGWHIRALDSVFRQYGVDAVFCSHDHIVERCLTGPAGFETTMDDKDPANLNYLVQGNSGEGARSPQTGWETWMDITGNNGPPYYTKYFYDWVNTDYRSYTELDIQKLNPTTWQATFRTVRSDGAIFDEFSFQRTTPEPLLTFSKKVTPMGTISSGGTLTYTLSYENIGSGTATNLVLIDGIPDGTTYISNSAYGGTGNIYYSHDGGLNYDSSQTAPVTHIKWEIGDVEPKGNGNVYFDVRVE
ncbi:MAG: lamin tail domain-containing protein [bacterium]